uniref:Uncharacterized protein n=1 Tax=viral metagenome TaxID=1070528 RepID=A0A6M3M203_9ZZZZ
MAKRRKRPPITPDDPFTGTWCRSCRHLSTSKNFCLLGPRTESCINYKYDKHRDFGRKDYQEEKAIRAGLKALKAHYEKMDKMPQNTLKERTDRAVANWRGLIEIEKLLYQEGEVKNESI